MVLDVGTGQGVTVRELVAAFGRASGGSVPVIDSHPGSGDAVGAYANVDRIQRLLDWSCRSSLEEALQSALKRSGKAAGSAGIRLTGRGSRALVGCAEGLPRRHRCPSRQGSTYPRFVPQRTAAPVLRARCQRWQDLACGHRCCRGTLVPEAGGTPMRTCKTPAGVPAGVSRVLRQAVSSCLRREATTTAPPPTSRSRPAPAMAVSRALDPVEGSAPVSAAVVLRASVPPGLPGATAAAGLRRNRRDANAA